MNLIKNKYQKIVEASLRDFKGFSKELIIDIIMEKISSVDAMTDYEKELRREYISELTGNLIR